LRTSKDAKILFKIKYRDQDKVLRHELLSNDLIVNLHRKCKILENVEVGPLWPGEAVIITLQERFGSNYLTVDYLVISTTDLTAKDFEILRGQGCFVRGGQCGKVYNHEIAHDGTHMYEVRSITEV
jgi:hypothetical protein